MLNGFYHNQGFVVPPLSIQVIHLQAQEFRRRFSKWIDKDGKIDLIHILELDYKNGNGYQIMPYSPDAPLGLTTADGTVHLRQDVYDDVVAGNGRARFTLSHEFGHAILHTEYIGFARHSTSSDKLYKNSEWQANEFAGALLLPDYELVKNKASSIEDLVEQFGVSNECARIRREKAQKRGIL